MSAKMRVIAGSIKGRIIPFVNSKYGNADITSQIVKEAYFDIISSHVRSSRFLDLFACSGQIGLEAFSRGASLVCLVEKDRRRFSFISDFKKKLALNESFAVHCTDAYAFIRQCAIKQNTFDLVYLDPPYHKEKGTAAIYADLIDVLSKSGIVSESGIITVQHFSSNILPDSLAGWTSYDNRTYGQNSLTFYRRDSIIL
jgi:16S rRNA (guanine966-N2)-methyltransferase